MDALLLILLPGLVYLPGHLLGGALVRKGEGWGESVLLRAAAGIAVALPVLVGLALFGWFTVPVVAGSLGALSLAAWVLRRPLGGGVAGRRPRSSRWDLALLGFVGGSFAVYGRPAEYVINNRDPGVYAVVADKLARTGDFLTRDPLVEAVMPFHTFLDAKKYPGFYIYGDGLIVPQFFPGPYAWVGLGNLAGGLSASLYVVPVFGALSVGAAFMLGRELFGRWAGLLGALLLAASYTQVWWSRQPSSEIITQFFVLSGLWLAARFLSDGTSDVAGRRRILTGVLAGTLLGGAMLVRVDAFLAVAAVPLAVCYDLLTRRSLRPVLRRWLPLLASLVVFAGIALLYVNTIGGRYLYLIYTSHGLDRALALFPYIAVITLAAATGVYLFLRRWGATTGRLLSLYGRRISLVLALGLAGVVLWGYFVVPVPWDTLPDVSGDFDAYRSQILLRLTWFLTPPVAVLGLAGFILAAARLTTARALLLGAVLAFGVLYALVPNVAPDLPWATRRFVPTVFPGIALLAGYAAVEAGKFVNRIWDRRAGVAVSAALAALALGFTVYTTVPVLQFRELAGTVAVFERLEDEIPPADVVYMELPDGFDHYASPLEYVHGEPVLPYDRARFRREVDELAAAGLLDDAVYVTAHGGPPPLVSGLSFREVGQQELRVPQLEHTTKELPTRVGELRAEFRVYRVEEAR